jgi:hypothetical protein
MAGDDQLKLEGRSRFSGGLSETKMLFSRPSLASLGDTAGRCLCQL